MTDPLDLDAEVMAYLRAHVESVGKGKLPPPDQIEALFNGNDPHLVALSFGGHFQLLLNLAVSLSTATQDQLLKAVEASGNYTRLASEFPPNEEEG